MKSFWQLAKWEQCSVVKSEFMQISQGTICYGHTVQNKLKTFHPAGQTEIPMACVTRLRMKLRRAPQAMKASAWCNIRDMND